MLGNVIAGEERPAAGGRRRDLRQALPATGDLISRVARSRAEDADVAVSAAAAAQPVLVGAGPVVLSQAYAAAERPEPNRALASLERYVASPS